jgi:dephospho-CoA kinase
MIIGITGGMGAGKSAVTQIIRENGFVVLDADVISREVTRKDAPLLRMLVKEFGIEIINEDGTLNRRLLADIAFADKQKTNRLNDLVQTAILVRAFERIYQMGLRGHDDIVFFDVPMLFEAEWQGLMNQVWLVTAPEDVRIERVLARDGLSLEEIKTRMSLQMSEEEKKKKADVVINNSSDLEYLQKQVRNLLEGLRYLN